MGAATAIAVIIVIAALVGLCCMIPTYFRHKGKTLPPNDKPAVESCRTPVAEKAGTVRVQHDDGALEQALLYDTREGLNLERGAATLFYEWIGDAPAGAPVMVLLSGCGIGADFWSVDADTFPAMGPKFATSLAAQLGEATGFRVLTLDYRGQGRSTYSSDVTPTTDRTVAYDALDVLAVLRHLKIEGPCHFVGSSLGMAVSAAVAGLAPGMVASITGHGTSLGPPTGLVGPQKPLSNRLVQKLLGAKFFATATEGAALVKPKGLLFQLFCYGPGLDGFQKGFVASGHTDCRAVLPTLTAPFMTIFSTHDEQFFKRKDVEAYHAKVGSDLIGEANEELVVWETDADGGKCGHMVPFENPKEFVACVVRNVAKAKTESV